MVGNVWEWCFDWYGAYEVKVGGAVVDPRGAVQGDGRVNRGGSWNDVAVYCRSANRDGTAPAIRSNLLGFRPALVPSGEIAISGSKGDSLASNQVRLEIGLGRRVTESQAQTRDSSPTPGASQGENGRAKPKDAGITQGDIFPVQVQEVFDPDGKPEKSESMEYWALKFNSDFSKGELLVIVQVEAMGQKYPLYHMYPFSDVIRGDNTLTLRVKQPLAESPRIITINLALDGKSFASVSGTLTTRSILSGTVIKKIFKNIDDKDFKLFIDRPN